MEQLRSQQEQTLGTLDTRIDEMMETRTQAIMDRLDGHLGIRRGSRNRGAHSREASREPRVNLNEHPNRGRTYGSIIGRGSSSSNATCDNRPRNSRTIRESPTGSRKISNELPTRDADASERGKFRNWNRSDQGRAPEKVPEPQKQRWLIKWDIHRMQRRWPRHLNL